MKSSSLYKESCNPAMTGTSEALRGPISGAKPSGLFPCLSLMRLRQLRSRQQGQFSTAQAPVSGDYEGRHPDDERNTIRAFEMNR
jgi:hypothetical protein